MKNILDKVRQLKNEFSGLGIKPSGYNAHQKFKYYEVSDFIGVTVKLLDKLDMTVVERVTSELYCLDVYDITTGEVVTYSVPFEPSSNIKDKVQATGAGLTYCKRYIYTSLLSLDEQDQLDGQDLSSKPNKAQAKTYTKPVIKKEEGFAPLPANYTRKEVSTQTSGIPAGVGSPKQRALIERHIEEGNKNNIVVEAIVDRQSLQEAIKQVFGN